MCLELCRDSGCCRCVRARTRVVPCGALLAAVEVAIEVARRAIAPIGAHTRPAGTDGRVCEAGVSCEVLLTLYGCMACLEWVLGPLWSA